MSKGVTAQFHDLKSQVDHLQGQLNGCQFKMDALRREVADKQQLLEGAGSSQMETRKRASLLKLENRTLRIVRDNV